MRRKTQPVKDETLRIALHRGSAAQQKARQQIDRLKVTGMPVVQYFGRRLIRPIAEVTTASRVAVAAALELTCDVVDVLSDTIAKRDDEGLPSTEDVGRTFEEFGKKARLRNRRVK